MVDRNAVYHQADNNRGNIPFLGSNSRVPYAIPKHAIAESRVLRVNIYVSDSATLIVAVCVIFEEFVEYSSYRLMAPLFPA